MNLRAKLHQNICWRPSAKLLMVVNSSAASFSVILLAAILAAPALARSSDPFVPDAETLERRELVDLVREARTDRGQEEARRRVDKVVGITCISLLIAGLILNRRPKCASGLGRLALFGSAMCASAYIGNGIYFDFILGETSSASRAGAYVTASVSSPMFWVILIGKILVLAMIFIMGLRLLKKNQTKSK